MAVGAPHLIAGISQVKENTDSGVFNAIQFAGIAALEGPESNLDQLRDLYQRRRDLVLQTLRDIGLSPDTPVKTSASLVGAEGFDPNQPKLLSWPYLLVFGLLSDRQVWASCQAEWLVSRICSRL